VKSTKLMHGAFRAKLAAARRTDKDWGLFDRTNRTLQMKLRNVSVSADQRAITSSGKMHVALTERRREGKRDKEREKERERGGREAGREKERETGSASSRKCAKPHECAHRHITPSQFDSYIHREIAERTGMPEGPRLLEG